MILLNYNNEAVQGLKIHLPGVRGWAQSHAQQIAVPVTPDPTNPTVGMAELDLLDIDVITWGTPSLS